jgi:hypothetical protein
MQECWRLSKGLKKYCIAFGLMFPPAQALNFGDTIAKPLTDILT